MKISKKTIALAIVPAFALVGCQPSDNSVATNGSVTQNADGSYVQVADTLNRSYEEAKSNGYTGTYEDWVKLLELHQTNPQQAAQQAAQSGFNGMDMLMAGAMGMMLGNMMSNGSMNAYKSSSYYDDDRKRRASGSYVYSGRQTYSTPPRSTSASSQSYRSESRTVSRSTTTRGGFGGAVSTGG